MPRAGAAQEGSDTLGGGEGALSSGLGPQGGQAGREGRWAWAGAPRAPEGSVPSAPACWACLTFQTAPAAAALGLRVQAGGRARGRQPPPAHLSAHVHTARPAVWWEMRTGGGGPQEAQRHPHGPTPLPLPVPPVQGCRLQGALSWGAPGQGAPPFLGGGSMHLLWRLRWPPPQETLQGPQASHTVQAPATAGKEGRRRWTRDSTRERKWQRREQPGRPPGGGRGSARGLNCPRTPPLGGRPGQRSRGAF